MPRSRIPFVCLSVLVLLGLSGAPSVTAAPTGMHYSAGEPTGNEYEDQVLGAGQTEGDVWGGEQGTTPAEDPLPTATTSVEDVGDLRWFGGIATVFAWLRASLWFTQPD